MRFALICLPFLPLPALAETFTVTSTPNAATVYAQGAVVERRISVDIPAGSHEILLPDLPQGLVGQNVRVGISGATLTGSRFRANALPPAPDPDTPAIAAARARIKAIKAQLTDVNDQVSAIRLRIDAAQAQQDFLTGLGQQDSLPDSVETLRQMAQMIGAQTLAARQEALAAGQDIRDLEDTRADLKKDLKDARDALDALVPRSVERSQITLAVDAAEAGAAQIDLSYTVSAQWSPVYDIFLDQGDQPGVRFRRNATVQQQSGENWDNITLRLSTLRLEDQIAPSEVFPQQVWLQPELAKSRSVSGASLDMMESREAAASPPVLAEMAAVAVFDGPGVSYDVPKPTTVSSGADQTRVALDELRFDARLFARATPLMDQTAFLMGAITNTTQEPLLAAGTAAYHVGNTLVGTGYFEQVPAGAQADLAFGAINGLRLSRVVLDRSQGDRGLFGGSNARIEEVRIDVENLTGKPWPVELFDRVPFSEDDDLEVSWSATPSPNDVNHDDKRGVLRWSFDLGGAEIKSIRLNQDIRWPEGSVLR